MSCFALLMCAYVSPSPASAVAGINQQINFQGRLLNSQGATVPDGYYNIQFKIYQDGPGTAVGNPGGTLLWTESHLNDNSQGVTVKNGFLSVQLGSINAFGNQVDWNQDTIWLSMNIGNTNVSCTPFSSCSPDGEMVPMKRMAAVPYSLNSGLLNGLASTNFVQLAQGVQTDASAGPSSIFINKTNTGNLLQLQSSGSDAFTIDNAGDLTFGAAANHSISVTTAAASTAGKQLTVSAGGGGSGTGSVGGDLVLQGGAAGGTNGNGGNTTINAGAKTGTGTDGTISIGTANTSGIVLGVSTVLSANQSLTLTGGATGTRPATPTNGMLYYDTTTSQLLVYNGTHPTGKWQADRSTATKIIAPSNASQAAKDAADVILTGTGDQTLINTALGTAAGGKVYIMEGTVTISGSIAIPNNTMLTGAGNGTIIKLANGINSNINAITNTDITTGAGISIRDLSLDGNKANNSSGTQAGVWMDHVGDAIANRAGAKITNVEANNFRTYGIVSAFSANTIITGSTTNANDHSGIVFSSNALGTISGNAADNNASYGIWLLGSNSVAVSNNTTYANGVVNIHIQSGTYNTVTANSSLSGTQYGIYLTSTSYSTVTANTITSNALSGLFLLGANNNALTGNSLYNNGDATTNNAIQLNNSDSNNTTGNNINDSSCTTNCYAINIVNATSDTNHLGNNHLGNGTINDASGGDTIYTGQNNGSSYLIQPVDDFAITGNAASTISTTAGNLTVQGGSGTVSLGTSTNLTAGGNLTIASAASSSLTLTSNATATWGTTSGNLTLDAGAALNVGTANATSLSLSRAGATTTVNGALTLVTGQNLTVNGDVLTDLTGSGLMVSSSALTVDASSSTGFFRNGGNSFSGSATLGTNDSNSLAIRTNSTTRATFDTSNNLYLGNGATSVTPSNFVVQGTTSAASGVSGGNLTVQGGGANTGNANGGNLTLSGGTGSGTGYNGTVLITTPTMQQVTDSNCNMVIIDCTIAAASLSNNATIVVGINNTTGKTVTLPDPANTTAGRLVYITAANGSSDFTLSVNGGALITNLIAMRQNTSATMIWNGSDWTAAGASSSTTLQAAYDNTLQSSGGAELVVSRTSNTNGLTIRDSIANPVAGPLLSIQSKSAANLFSVNSNVTEYASNPGAETQGASASTFPSTTWSSYGTGASITRNTTTNNNTIATGQASVAVTTSGGSSLNTGTQNQIVDSSGAALALLANNHYNVSFSVRLPDGAATFNDLNVRYQYDGTAGNTVACTTGKVVAQNVWTKVNCSFTTPAAGVTSANVIRIEQGSTASRTFYVDNLSVTIAADYSLATDGSVDAALGSNWNAVNGATPVTRSTSFGNNASSSVEVTTSTTTNQGVNNLLSIKPLQNTLYRVTVYLASTTNMSNAFDIRYSPDNGSTFVSCEDYNTTTISTSLTAFTKVTCYIPTGATAVTTPHVYFRKTDATARVFYVDTFSMTLAAPSTPNIQVGSGTNGGPTTLFTLDRGASAPIAGDNESLLGSMYYDTTLGKLQCYEADGWGACGSSPDNIITISPEYTNAVMHGTGVGTMISDLCSDFLNINDGSSSQPTICSTNETYNFYNWTSPQASLQTYSVYVTYQLPSTFKSFTSGSTSLQGRVSSTSNASVGYGIYKNTGSSMTQCGGDVSVANGAPNAWETKVASGAADPSACGFAAGDSVVFKISLSSRSNANAYIGNIGFSFSNN